jgi:hypothetical protein
MLSRWFTTTMVDGGGSTSLRIIGGRERLDSLHSGLPWMCGSVEMITRTQRISSAAHWTLRWLQSTASWRSVNF